MPAYHHPVPGPGQPLLASYPGLYQHQPPPPYMTLQSPHGYMIQAPHQQQSQPPSPVYQPYHYGYAPAPQPAPVSYAMYYLGMSQQQQYTTYSLPPQQ